MNENKQGIFLRMMQRRFARISSSESTNTTQTTARNSASTRPSAVNWNEHTRPLINAIQKLINAGSIESEGSGTATTQTISFYCWDMLITSHPKWPVRNQELRGWAAERGVIDVAENRTGRKLLREKDFSLYFAVRLCALQPSSNRKLHKTHSSTLHL